MMTKPQIINGRDGKPAYAVLAIEDYERLIARAEDKADAARREYRFL